MLKSKCGNHLYTKVFSSQFGKSKSSFTKSFVNYNKFSFSSVKNVKGLENDLFQKNFQLNTPPENMVSYNDMDMSMASEVFKNIDLENLSNLPLLSGRFSRLWCLIEDSMHHFVMFITHDINLGIGTSIIVLAASIRLLFFPVTKRHFRNGQLTRLIFPETMEFQERTKKLKEAGEIKLSMIENKKYKQLKESYGIKTSPLMLILTLTQGMLIGTWAGLVQRFSYNIEDYPEMMTGGLLWFKDLSMSDPYFILPILNSFLIMLNIYSRRFLFIAPIFSLPMFCTLETGIVLYFSVLSGVHFLIQAYLNSESSKKKLGVNNFLPGTKLEKMNKFRLSGTKFEDTPTQISAVQSTVVPANINESTSVSPTDKQEKEKEKLKPVVQQRKGKKKL